MAIEHAFERLNGLFFDEIYQENCALFVSVSVSEGGKRVSMFHVGLNFSEIFLGVFR